MRAAIAVLIPTTMVAACGGGKPAPAAPSSNGGGGDAAAIGQAGGPSIVEVFDGLRLGNSAPGICFAWSATTMRAACGIEDSSIQGGATLGVRLVGAVEREFRYYQHPEGHQFFDMVPEGFDDEAFDEAQAALAADRFVPWQFVPVALAPGAEITVGDATLRRVREQTGTDGDEMTGEWEVSTDRVERRCGDRWVALPFADHSFGNAVEPADIAVFATPAGGLVATASVSWGIEGDHGGAADAALVPACP